MFCSSLICAPGVSPEEAVRRNGTVWMLGATPPHVGQRITRRRLRLARPGRSTRDGARWVFLRRKRRSRHGLPCKTFAARARHPTSGLSVNRRMRSSPAPPHGPWTSAAQRPVCRASPAGAAASGPQGRSRVMTARLPRGCDALLPNPGRLLLEAGTHERRSAAPCAANETSPSGSAASLLQPVARFDNPALRAADVWRIDTGEPSRTGRFEFR